MILKQINLHTFISVACARLTQQLIRQAVYQSGPGLSEGLAYSLKGSLFDCLLTWPPVRGPRPLLCLS